MNDFTFSTMIKPSFGLGLITFLPSFRRRTCVLQVINYGPAYKMHIRLLIKVHLSYSKAIKKVGSHEDFSQI